MSRIGTWFEHIRGRQPAARHATAHDELRRLLLSVGVSQDYSAIDVSGVGVDLQGWGAEHPLVEQVIDELRPSLVIEVGVWKGGSLLRMLQLARERGCTTAFIAVDTWLGSFEHWLDPRDREYLGLVGGYPSLYRQFVANLIAHDATGDVFALPMTSSAAARVLQQLGVVADIVHIDASHDEVEVSADIREYWKRVRAGGVMFGDDYHPSWPGVVRSVDSFARKNRLRKETSGGRWLLRRREA